MQNEGNIIFVGIKTVKICTISLIPVKYLRDLFSGTMIPNFSKCCKLISKIISLKLVKAGPLSKI